MANMSKDRVGDMVPTITTNEIKAGELDEDVTGVHWADTGWTECRSHLLDRSWAIQITGSDEATGVALYGEVECDACAEDNEDALLKADDDDEPHPVRTTGDDEVRYAVESDDEWA